MLNPCGVNSFRTFLLELHYDRVLTLKVLKSRQKNCNKSPFLVTLPANLLYHFREVWKKKAREMQQQQQPRAQQRGRTLGGASSSSSSSSNVASVASGGIDTAAAASYSNSGLFKVLQLAGLGMPMNMNSRLLCCLVHPARHSGGGSWNDHRSNTRYVMPKRYLFVL